MTDPDRRIPASEAPAGVWCMGWGPKTLPPQFNPAEFFLSPTKTPVVCCRLGGEWFCPDGGGGFVPMRYEWGVASSLTYSDMRHTRLVAHAPNEVVVIPTPILAALSRTEPA